MEEERTNVCIELEVNGQCFFVCFSIAYESLGCCSPSILNLVKCDVSFKVILHFFFPDFLSMWGHKCTGNV